MVVGGCGHTPTYILTQPTKTPPYSQIVRCEDFENLGDTVFDALSNATALQELYLGTCTEVTSKGVMRLARACKQLRHFTTHSFLKVGSNGFKALARLPKLETLKIPVAHHVGWRSLHALTKHATRLRTLDLSRCDVVENAFLDRIARRMVRLKKLELCW